MSPLLSIALIYSEKVLNFLTIVIEKYEKINSEHDDNDSVCLRRAFLFSLSHSDGKDKKRRPTVGDV